MLICSARVPRTRARSNLVMYGVVIRSAFATWVRVRVRVRARTRARARARARAGLGVGLGLGLEGLG